MLAKRDIYCCGCQERVSARLTKGAEIYPHRPDLVSLPFWKCDTCGNHVGCHHKTKEWSKPLGNIPTQELRAARISIHAIIDPLWQNGKMKRGQLYQALSKVLGRQYHTGELKTMEEAMLIRRKAKELQVKCMLKNRGKTGVMKSGI